MGWSTYANFLSKESLALAPATNTIRAVSRAYAERIAKHRNISPYVRLEYFPISTGMLIGFYLAIVNDTFIGGFIDPVTYEQMTLAKIAEEVEILPNPSTIKLKHVLESDYWFMFAEILNRLICCDGAPGVVSIEDYKAHTAYGDFYTLYGTGFPDLVSFLNSNPTGSVSGVGNVNYGGSWNASCVSTNNDHWVASVYKNFGTIEFDAPATLLWKTSEGRNNTWSGNYTDVPLDWEIVATNSATITIPQWNLLSIFPYTPVWASSYGTSNSISQNISYKYYRYFNADSSGSFEFIEGS